MKIMVKNKVIVKTVLCLLCAGSALALTGCKGGGEASGASEETKAAATTNADTNAADAASAPATNQDASASQPAPNSTSQ